MITTEIAKIGDTVKFKLWVRPYKELTGKIIAIKSDKIFGGKQKEAKYIIKPDEKVPEIPNETTYRFHPFTKLKVNTVGEPILDEQGQKQYEYPVGIMDEDIIDIIPN